MRRSARWSAGTSGFPKRRGWSRWPARRSFSIPTAIGWERGEVEPVRRRQLQAWETVQRGHAIANGMFVAVVNRVGTEDSLEFWGNSFVADPFGEVIARAGASAEEILIADCDLALIEETRRNWPFLRDRRIDAYGDLLRRFRS